MTTSDVVRVTQKPLPREQQSAFSCPPEPLLPGASALVRQPQPARRSHFGVRCRLAPMGEASRVTMHHESTNYWKHVMSVSIALMQGLVFRVRQASTQWKRKSLERRNVRQFIVTASVPKHFDRRRKTEHGKLHQTCRYIIMGESVTIWSRYSPYPTEHILNCKTKRIANERGADTLTSGVPSYLRHHAGVQTSRRFGRDCGQTSPVWVCWGCGCERVRPWW